MLVLFLLAGALFGSDRLAFRDVSHFYTPLYQYVAERTSQQWIPLWNPRCQTGMPLLGDTTTAVLYPVRYALGSLPISAERQIAWYVALHLILASLLARVAASRAGARRVGRMVAGLTYPLSGSVFFLYCNPPFLVGAAWLPLAISMLIDPGHWTARLRIAVSALAISMMILAGDPQTALHVIILAGVVTGLRVVRKKTQPREIITLIAAAVLAAAMAAPQIAASVSWTRQSDRAYSGISQAEAMQYSVPPWHFAELFTPNLFGTPFPVNQRISALIPGDGQMWTTTLFMGLLPAVMLLDRLLRWRRTDHDVWLLVAAIAATLAMGHFGLVWWLQWFTGSLRQFDSASLGPYGWLYQYFPGYDTLRYPAKWLPFFAIGLSMACARWVDIKTLLGAGKAFTLTSVVLLLAMIATYWIPANLAATPTDEFWGPLDLVGARQAIFLSLSLTLASLTALLVAFWKFHPTNPRWAVGSMLMLLAIELTWSASTQLQVVSIDAERSIINRMVDDDAQTSERLIRMQAGSLWPESWLETSSQDRLLQVEATGRACLFGRWHLIGEHAVVNNFVSIRSRQHAIFWKVITELQASGERIDWNAIQTWLAVDRTVIQSAGELQSRRTMPRPEAIELRSNWQWHPLGEVTEPGENGEKEQRNQIRKIAIGQDAVPIFVSPDALIADPTNNQATATWSVLERSPERLLVEVTCDHPVLLVRPTYQDGNWTALRGNPQTPQAAWKTSHVGQVNFLKQGTVVPPGCWEIQFTYQPWWWLPSVVLALVAWVTASVLVTDRITPATCRQV